MVKKEITYEVKKHNERPLEGPLFNPLASHLDVNCYAVNAVGLIGVMSPFLVK